MIIDFIDFFENGIGRVSGMFTLEHLIYVITSLLIVFFLLYITRKKSNEEIFKIIKIVSVVFLVLEILKIIWNLTLREVVTVNDWIPLYFCSFFIYASLTFAFYTNKQSIVHKFALYFLFYGGITGGLAFLLLPTTALEVFPLLHVLSFHSLFYHSFMVTCAIWSLRFFTPKLSDIKIYGLFVIIIEALVVIINLICETNFMLLNKSFGLVILDKIYEFSPVLYPVISSIGQMLLTFFVGYGIYYFIIRHLTHKKVNHE